MYSEHTWQEIFSAPDELIIQARLPENYLILHLAKHLYEFGEQNLR